MNRIWICESINLKDGCKKVELVSNDEDVIDQEVKAYNNFKNDKYYIKSGPFTVWEK